MTKELLGLLQSNHGPKLHWPILARLENKGRRLIPPFSYKDAKERIQSGLQLIFGEEE